MLSPSPPLAPLSPSERLTGKGASWGGEGRGGCPMLGESSPGLGVLRACLRRAALGEVLMSGPWLCSPVVEEPAISEVRSVLVGEDILRSTVLRAGHLVVLWLRHR